MKVTEDDFEGVETFGYPYNVDEHGWVQIDFPHATIEIHKRPIYCDRGRFGLNVEVKREAIAIMSIDNADAFPRYFFSLQNLFNELNEWEKFNSEKLGTNG